MDLDVLRVEDPLLAAKLSHIQELSNSGQVSSAVKDESALSRRSSVYMSHRSGARTRSYGSPSEKVRLRLVAHVNR